MPLNVNQLIRVFFFLSLHSKLFGDSNPLPSIGTLISGNTTLSVTFFFERHRFSERAVQSVVVVFEVLQLQEVSGPLAALLRRRCEVGGLGGGGGGGACRLRGAGQVFGCRLVVLARRAAAARLDAKKQ